VTADDGIRLWVDGDLLIDAWTDQSPTSYQVTRTLTAGSHAVKVEYYENGGGAVVGLSHVAALSSQLPPPSGGGGSLAFAPPTLSNPITVNVSNANRRLFLNDTRDYRLNLVEPLKKELWIEGGRNVVVIGGRITIDDVGGSSSYQDNTAVKVRFGDSSGTVHLEGLLIDGPYVADGIGIATGRNVQIENVRVEQVSEVKGAHPDCVQIQQGVRNLRMDRFTCRTALQGIFLGDHDGAIGGVDLRRVNMYGTRGKHMFFQTNPSYPVSLSDVWLAIAPGYTEWAAFGYWVYPQQDGRTWDGKTDLTRRSQVSSDGRYLTFVGSSNTISGTISKGVPSGGDFVPSGRAGTGYQSPGYS
jgi:hypothetical protein